MLTTLSYSPNTADLFDAIAGLAGAVFLDSGSPYGQQGRFDIISACPYITLTTQGLTTIIETENGILNSDEDPFLLVKNYLKQATFTPVPAPENLPFIGGAIGFFAYDLARRLEKLPTLAQQDLPLSDMVIGIYDWAIIIDHHAKKSRLIQQNNSRKTGAICADVLKKLQQSVVTTHHQPVKLLADFQANFTPQTYAAAFNRIQTYLRQGDCYQVNLAQRFQAPVAGSPWQIYKLLRQHNPAPYAAFLNHPDASVLSLSPERFLQVHDNHVETKPIKGTQPRDPDPERDQALAQLLLNSEKDRAENLMIVDLLRNDLSKVCVPGTVKVPHLLALESFPAVHHLVSTITGQLMADKHSMDLLRACFPGGSITGAPKIRAMEIIETLEPHRRNLYCGAIGYIDFNGNMDTNIAIRTLIWHQQQLYCYAGGAITIDSECQAEYAETFAKISVILRVLNKL